MDRRKFLRTSIGSGLAPLVLNGLSVNAFAESPLLQFLGKSNKNRIAVLLQLNGGNDGLNTVIPIDQYSFLSNSRSNILIPEAKVLALTGTTKTGLHPAMNELRSLYDEGRLSIVQNVGYPNPDFSHFRATDIWLTGSDSNQFVETGWMGRYLDLQFAGFPTGYPNEEYPDPPAIQIGAMISPALQGQHASLGMSITNPSSFYQFVNGTVDPAPNTPAGHELSFLRLVAQQTQQYSGSVKTAADKGRNLSSKYPAAGTNSLADQLKIVAQLISGGLSTQVYMVSLGGFDTHSAQVDLSAKENGSHATLLQKISQAVNAFQDDLKLLGVDDRVLGMTFSEFGRRIKSNASLGTDHGTSAPLFLFGKHIKGGIYGKNPVIPQNASVNDNVPMEFDFRSIYGSILKEWFEISDTERTEILLKDFPTLDLIAGSATGYYEKSLSKKLIVFPNPTTGVVNIQFENQISGEPISLEIFDMQGRKQELGSLQNNSDNGIFRLDLSHLPAGNYAIQLQQGRRRWTEKLMKVD
ncbi:hypothetical protein MASR2M44_05710 [Bacteroidota bacterium]